jgi:uncharacterized RDD family membrane protein YckC
MKCPKCGYLGFETSDRCRNCGYDFSLSVTSEPRAELPLRPGDDAAGPLADFDLGPTANAPDGGLDLDRLIGGPAADDTVERRRPRAAAHARTAAAVSRDSADPLPLFPSEDGVDAPLTPPRRALPPLSVRRTTPEISRTRPRVVTPSLPVVEEGGEEQDEFVEHRAPAHPLDDLSHVQGPAAVDFIPAGRNARVIAALIDLVLLAAIDSGVVYLTLALTRLDTSAITTLPWVPLALFFAILDGGYLIAFVAASGQTIGKMITGVRVIGDDGKRVDIGSASLRAIGCLLSLLTAGLGYLPALLGSDRRALQDRISGTRVVSAR